MGAGISATQQGDGHGGDELQQYVLEITTRLERLEKMTKELVSKTNQLCHNNNSRSNRLDSREQEIKN